MQCPKCGSNYVSIQKSESKDEGIIIQTFYCAECKKYYENVIENPPLQGFKKIMTVAHFREKIIVGLYEDKIGILETKGQYNFLPKGCMRFELSEANAIYFRFRVESPKNPSYEGESILVTALEIEPEYEADYLDTKAYQLRDEAIEGKVPELSSDFVNLLNELLIKASGNKNILSFNKANNGGCYIATSVYGSYDCPQVWTLRRYRDYSLSKTWYGMTFIRIYYAISPTIVRLFGKTKWFNRLCRKRLDVFVAKLRNMGIENTPYSDRF